MAFENPIPRLLELAANRWSLQIVLNLPEVMKLHRRNSLLTTGLVAESLQEHSNDGLEAAA